MSVLGDVMNNDGGPAFPVAYEHSLTQGGTRSQEWGGMSLRDYFAAHAPEIPQWFERKITRSVVVKESMKDGHPWFSPETVVTGEADMDWLIRWRYTFADAMIKARQ